MGAKAELDFTELLDDLLAASAEAEEGDDDDLAAPSLRVDMLAQIERLRAQNAPCSADRVMREYRENAAGPATNGPTANGQVAKEKPAAQATAPDLQPALEDLFFLDPQSISRELGIDAKSKPEDLDRARRAFAMRYHPDRMPEEMRERAALRMQIANMLIDEAKRRKR
ncbi:MAG: hypothetical protein F9K43_05375 [Bauldia sp.]|nr:MAG: hypothetical protein F9K43_05375 [Bauldia sp.]